MLYLLLVMQQLSSLIENYRVNVSGAFNSIKALNKIIKKQDSFCLFHCPAPMFLALTFPDLLSKHLCCQPRDELLSFWRSGGVFERE